MVVLDEAQRIKNWATKSAAYVKALSPRYRLVLTGTPMENRLDELASHPRLGRRPRARAEVAAACRGTRSSEATAARASSARATSTRCASACRPAMRAARAQGGARAAARAHRHARARRDDRSSSARSTTSSTSPSRSSSPSGRAAPAHAGRVPAADAAAHHAAHHLQRARAAPLRGDLAALPGERAAAGAARGPVRAQAARAARGSSSRSSSSRSARWSSSASGAACCGSPSGRCAIVLEAGRPARRVLHRRRVAEAAHAGHRRLPRRSDERP